MISTKMKKGLGTMQFIAIAAALLLDLSPAFAQANLQPADCILVRLLRQNDVRRTPIASFTRDEAGEIVYSINGNESWRRTEVKVTRGQTVEISANGMVRWAPDGLERIDVGPEGTRPPYRSGWNYNHFPFPEAGIGSLVMRIGNGIYPIGPSRIVDAEDEGFVEFMVNDDVLSDNGGQFFVRARVLHENR